MTSRNSLIVLLFPDELLLKQSSAHLNRSTPSLFIVCLAPVKNICTMKFYSGQNRLCLNWFKWICYCFCEYLVQIWPKNNWDNGIRGLWLILWLLVILIPQFLCWNAWVVLRKCFRLFKQGLWLLALWVGMCSQQMVSLEFTLRNVKGHYLKFFNNPRLYN